MNTASTATGDQRHLAPAHLTPRIRDRLQRVRRLHVRGRTRAQIARQVGVSERTITTDMARIDQLRALEFASRIDTHGRLHSRDVHTAVQAAAWTAIHTILDPPTNDPSDPVDHDHDRHRNLAPLLRVVSESQRAIDALPPPDALAAATAADLVNFPTGALPTPPSAPSTN